MDPTDENFLHHIFLISLLVEYLLGNSGENLLGTIYFEPPCTKDGFYPY